MADIFFTELAVRRLHYVAELLFFYNMPAFAAYCSDSNASGDRMIKPLLVNKSLWTRALKGKDLKH